MIAIVLGTRPEVIKMSPIIRECETQDIPYFSLHTGQHYSYEMDRIFFEELNLPRVSYKLNISSGSHAEQTGAILTGVERVLVQEHPDLVLVEGDTNTVIASALAAVKLHIPVGHIEAGLRSYDRTMPEEINRIVTDHISDHLFAPTQQAQTNLIGEGINPQKIRITGNTIVDAVLQNRKIAQEKMHILSNLNVEPNKYFLATIHREENVDRKGRLQGIFEGLHQIQEQYALPILFPMHPRTKKMIDKYRINVDNITVLPPLGYLDFLELEASSRLVLTDSGGVQEESCILGVPCVTLRDNTERPETLDVGANILAGADPTRILQRTGQMLQNQTSWENPYGDGTAGKQILQISSAVIHGE